MSIDLTNLEFDPELAQGAHNAVFVCLKIQPSEKVTVITDLASAEIAASLVAQLNRSGCLFHTFVLEECAARPPGRHAGRHSGRSGKPARSAYLQ